MSDTAGNIIPRVSLPRHGLLVVDYSDCVMINNQSVLSVRQQVREKWPDLREACVLQILGNIREYQIDPELFGGKGRNFRVLHAAWVVDPSMMYSVERALQSHTPNHFIKMFADYDAAERWINTKLTKPDSNETGV